VGAGYGARDSSFSSAARDSSFRSVGFARPVEQPPRVILKMGILKTRDIA
jgi:hypothetical protein